MTSHNEGRRAFLVGTALGAGAVASTALVPEALAKNHQQRHAAMDSSAKHHAEHVMQDMSGGHGAFFNDEDSHTLTAFTERLMPGAPGMPGATDAGVFNYIDLALAGAYADQQDFYRRGITQLDAHCTQAYGKPFRSLDAGAAGRNYRRARAGQGADVRRGRRHKRSSTRCARTRWKACSPTRSTAATRTSPAGASSAFPARKCNSLQKTC